MNPAARGTPAGGPGAALQAAVHRAHRARPELPAPTYSLDGGTTVEDHRQRTARLQHLGTRTRITLAQHQDYLAEGEVDTATLIADIDRHGPLYDTIAAALEVQNGPRHS